MASEQCQTTQQFGKCTDDSRARIMRLVRFAGPPVNQALVSRSIHSCSIAEGAPSVFRALRPVAILEAVLDLRSWSSWTGDLETSRPTRLCLMDDNGEIRQERRIRYPDLLRKHAQFFVPHNALSVECRANGSHPRRLAPNLVCLIPECVR